ncbi:MAG TPA: ATP-binding cassette domain-containing protein [Bacteroidia bacterium]|nr:ATP-binding cassette domain-containing protein [Bacteroidia bacterium]
MQLFAILAKAESGENKKGKEVVQSFLKEQLNQELVEQYLSLYEKYVEDLHQTSKKKDGSEKRLSLNSVKVLRICADINKELAQKQKIVVLIRLIEFVNSESGISPQELEFVSTVSESFNIDQGEFNCVKEYIESPEGLPKISSGMLLIDGRREPANSTIRHIYCEDLEGQLSILHVSSVNMYVFRYLGTATMYLNGQVIKPSKVNVFNQGASVRNPKIRPIYYSDVVGAYLSSEAKAKIVFEARHIDFFFNKNKQGLHDINIKEESGKLVGIMGGSGAGKSTLLKILNGLSVPTSGGVFINGINTQSGDPSISGQIGYIPQDDLLIEDLTVFQNLFYSAKLSFGNLPDDEITKRCNEVLSDLGLFEARGLKVGNPLEQTISGGQRKRLNIALELIREPGILFVDEPTSGLSSRDSENIMDLLKELTLKGKLVFVVIHQPSSDIFKMFDKLFILDTGGYPIYYGNPIDAVVYFKTISNQVNANESECGTCGNVNPEQIFNIIDAKVLDEYGDLTRNRKISAPEWNVHFVKHFAPHVPDDKHEAVPPADFSVPNVFSQFKTFVTRDILSKLTNTQYVVINLIEAPFLAFILAYLIRFRSSDAADKTGYIFRTNENVPTYIFMSVIVSLFLGLMVSAEEIIRDQKIRKREAFLNLSKASYLLSKVTIMFTISAIQMFLFVLVGNSILHIQGMWTDYWLILFSVCCFANLLGLNISASFNSAVTIYILIPFLIIPQLLLSGIVVKFDKLNPTVTSQTQVPTVGQVMASRWAFEALSVDQFKANKYEQQFYIYDKILSVDGFKKNFWYPRMTAKLSECQTNMKNPQMQQQTADDLVLLKNEIVKQLMQTPSVPYTCLDSLDVQHFTNSLANKTTVYLSAVNDFYIGEYNKVFDARDKLVQSLNSNDASRTAFLQEKDDYSNDNLSDVVTNHNDFTNKIIEVDHELIQRADPIFLDPIKSSIFGNAQFYAPTKRMFGQLLDTYWVNMGIIWVMTIVLMITLYFNGLKRLLYLFSNIKLPFLGRSKH